MYSNPTFDPNPLASHDVKNGAARVRVPERRDRPAAARPRVARDLPAGLDVQDGHRGDRARRRRRRQQEVPGPEGAPAPAHEQHARRTSAANAAAARSKTASSQSCNTTYGQVGLDLARPSRDRASQHFGVQHDAAAVGPRPERRRAASARARHVQGRRAAVRAGRDRPGPVAVTPLEMALVAEVGRDRRRDAPSRTWSTGSKTPTGAGRAPGPPQGVARGR